MLIIPKQHSSDIDDIDEYSELDRRIIIYDTSINLENKVTNGFSLVNISIQNGNVGGLQSCSELLYTVNMYYGTIDFPLIYGMNDKFEPSINFDAEVRIVDYGFAHKMIDKFKDTEDTSNHLLWLTKGKTVLFKDASSEHDENKVVSSDPRFYNLDHQILVTQDTAGFYTDAGLEIGFDMFARESGIGYKLRELIDKHTHIYVSHIHIEDPYKLLRANTILLNYVNDTICKIQNFALLALASSYTIIIDKELGYNVLNLKRMFKQMEKKNELFEVSNFFETIKMCHEELLESNLNIRLTIIYKDCQTNVSVLPLVKGEGITSNENISDIESYKYGVDTIVNGS